MFRFAQHDRFWDGVAQRAAKEAGHTLGKKSLPSRALGSTTDAGCFKIRPMPRLPFITFEGSEGCGKSTQVSLLAERLPSADVPLLVAREPGVLAGYHAACRC